MDEFLAESRRRLLAERAALLAPEPRFDVDAGPTTTGAGETDHINVETERLLDAALDEHAHVALEEIAAALAAWWTTRTACANDAARRSVTNDSSRSRRARTASGVTREHGFRRPLSGFDPEATLRQGRTATKLLVVAVGSASASVCALIRNGIVDP